MQKLSKRDISQRRAKDNATDLAGWVFADLLLGMSIIFLATISFHGGKLTSTSPSLISGISTGTTQSQSTREFASETELSKEYSDLNISKVIRDISEFLLQNQASNKSSIIYLKAVGGYSPSKDYSDSGSLLAARYAIALKKTNSPYFQNTSVDISTSPDISPGHVVLHFVFSKI